MAFAVERRDIVVSDLKIRLLHESGEERLFEWQGILQELGKMRTPDSGSMPFEKEQSVLAIKLNVKDVEERFIRCQETAFICSKQEYELKAVKKLSYMKSTEAFDSSAFCKCEEMQDLYSFIKHSFFWKTGKYKVIIDIQSPEPFELVDNVRTFVLTQLDIEELAKNKEGIEADYQNHIDMPEDNNKLVNWMWRNPALIKENVDTAITVKSRS